RPPPTTDRCRPAAATPLVFPSSRAGAVVGSPGLNRTGVVLVYHPTWEGGAMTDQARAFWLRTPGIGEIRPGTVGDPGPGGVLVYRRTWEGGGMPDRARAFGPRTPGIGEIRPVTVGAPGPGEVLVRAVCSAVSRGTESLVFRGEVPADQHTAMRAPFQEGDFP